MIELGEMQCSFQKNAETAIFDLKIFEVTLMVEIIIAFNAEFHSENEQNSECKKRQI